jgi:hypothetical protein
LWQLGILDGDERRRPDKLGVIFDFRVEGSDRVRPEDPKIVQVWEVWPGALSQPQVEWLIKGVSQRMPIVLRRGKED